MERKLCCSIFYIQTEKDDKLDVHLVKYLKNLKINLTYGDNPVEYIKNCILNQNSVQQVVNNNLSQQSIETDLNNSKKSNSDNSFNKSNDNFSIPNLYNKTIFVIKDFDCYQFKQVLPYTKSILGLPALKYYFKRQITIPINNRPIFNFSMRNLFICFANLSRKNVIQRYISLIHYMGASIRKDLNTSKITHLVSSKSSGTKYRIAITCGLPIMNLSWIDFAWQNRNEDNFDATDDNVVENFKLQPFSMLYFSFLNFSNLELNEMQILTRKNGGYVVSWEDERCTHLIIDAILGYTVELPIDLFKVNKNIYIVYKEWFWASLEIAGRADEKIINHRYPVPNLNLDINQSYLSERNLSFELLSPSFNFSTESILDSAFTENKNLPQTFEFQYFTKRRKVCMELLQTEKNYLDVLKIIINIFYKPLEEPVLNKYLLERTERKIIFGNLLPILDIHEGIYKDLEIIMNNWVENCSIGKIFINYSGSLLKAYPLFVNFFENTKAMLNLCDEKYPRFHAFLKKCQSRPECKRQSLSELLIRPIQRLPSIILLLTDILKNTDKSNEDYKKLKLAIEKIKEVLLHINEDKRKTDCQIAMFDIINDIEECPASLLSANRNFICKSDAKLILKNENKALPLKGYILTLFLFNDVLEICKKRSKRSESFNQKSNKTGSIISNVGSKQSNKKSYKHIDILPLEFIKIIYNFSLLEDYRNAITIVTKPTLLGTSRTYRTYPFILDNKESKPEFIIEKLCQQVNSNIVVKGSLSKILEIDFEYADQLAEKLNKSNFGFAKTKEKITRAFSIRCKQSTQNLINSINANAELINNTNNNSTFYVQSSYRLPEINSEISSPRGLSRAFSSFINIASPLSSSTNLNEIKDCMNDYTFSCPTTPAPRKKKCTAIQ